jgi:hypothetical protein
MGIAAADYDHSGLQSLIITNFSNQMLALYHNEGNGLFINESPHSEIGRASLLTLGFGCFWIDYNLDGWPDFFAANGHIDPGINAIQRQVHYAEPPLLFRNLGNGQFADVTSQMGASFNHPQVDRGAALGDINNDGAPDILVSTSAGPVSLFLNEGETNNSLRIKLVGVKSNRDGLDSVVKVQSGKMTQSQMLTSGSSYLSSSELVLTFGLGQQTKADSVEIDWPSGRKESLKNVAANQFITVKEGAGILASRPLNKRGAW